MAKSAPILKIAHLHVADKNNKGDVAIVLAVQELLRAHFKNCLILDFPVNILRAGDSRDLKKINRADLVVIGGGGIFYSYFLPYSREVVAGITKPIIIFGVGYIREIGAPELKREAAESVVALVKKAALVGVRDQRTKKFLVERGVRSSRVDVIGDPAVLLEEVKPRDFKIDSKKLSGKKSLKIKAPIRIGLNLNYSGWLGFGKWRNDILSAYREVVTYFQKEYGGALGRHIEIYYLKHHPGENNIYPELKIPGLKVVDLKPAEQKYVYGQLDLVIGMMLHAGVLAFGAGTPEISVAYDLRNYSFAEFIGCRELVVDLDKLKKGMLLKLAKEVFKKRLKYQAIFKHQKADIFKKQAEFLRKIKIN